MASTKSFIPSPDRPADTQVPSTNAYNTDFPSIPGSFKEDPEPTPGQPRQRRTHATASEPAQPQPQNGSRAWPPRQCRICLETVLPTYHPPSVSIPGIASTGSVSYESDDPASGRLLRPCKCKGSSRYVHEGCLQIWRHADPNYSKRNYWQCPTCKFQYRLQRMTWSRAINSTGTQIGLTISILFVTVLLFGLVADPIINLYLDPYSTITSGGFRSKIEPILTDDDEVTWIEYFIKGLVSLGLLSFMKVLFAMSPRQWWHVRSTGILNGGNRSGTTGRDRVANISWIVVVIGIGTFLWGVWKGVRAFSRRTLERASERVLDVPLENEEDEFDTN